MADLRERLQAALADQYRIEHELGSGGMAMVYLAEDLKHHRKVAVKVLRPELAATLGSDRFLREVETTAQFQHPHILPLLDSGEAGGFLYYVMPYVEGESLRSRLARRGELPIHDAVKILVEVCDALAYAHAHGVLHRDIKPDNVLLSGRHALVTDFGVAKALSEATGRQQFTTAGVALGTPAYMAPEQAAAEPNIDHRADIYGLGVLGYELVSGKPPFTGRTSQEVLAAHVTQPPEALCSRRLACPPGLEAVIMKCLEKRPADRWQTADELLAELEPLATPSGGTTPTATRPTAAVTPSPRRTAWTRWLLAASVLLALGVALALALTRPRPEVRLGQRVQITHTPGLEIDPALSPDGKFVAYAAGPLFATRLYVRQVDGGAPVGITPEGGGFARMPQWSPDGSRLLYLSNHGLESTPVLGGASRVLMPVPLGRLSTGTWSPDGHSIAFTLGDSVYIQSAQGGAVRSLARLPDAHSCAWSPNGRWIACVSGNSQFVRNGAFGNIAASSIWLIPTDGGVPVQITDDQYLNVSPAWLPGGTALLYVSNREGGRDLYRVELARSGRTLGTATRLTTGLNAAQVSVSADGQRLVYDAFTETSNVWSLPIPSSGTTSVRRAEPVTSGTQVVEAFDVSRDGSWLAIDSDRGGTQQIYREPLVGGEPEQLTTGAEPAFYPSISRDGREVAYHGFHQGRRQIFVISADGGRSTQVTAGETDNRAPDWSPDGRALTFVMNPFAPVPETKIVTRSGDGRWGAPKTLIKGGTIGVWSPDGRSVLTGPIGREIGWGRGIEIASAAGGIARVVVPVHNPATDIAPLYFDWSADGRLVHYLGQDPSDQSIGIWSVPAAGGKPRLEVKFDDPSRPWHRNGYRVRGGRFYFTVGDEQSDIWMTELIGSR